jgi:uncharacterized membrane protein YcaP (DUF421 family)
MEGGFFLLHTIVFAIIMIIVGFVAMRLAGRKSISQLTIAQTVIMIAVGSTLVEPVKSANLIITTTSIFVFIIVLIILEWISFYYEGFEKWFVGKEKIIIKDGEVIRKNLKDLRMTRDILEMSLRLQGISDYSHIEIATLETNGHVAVKFKEEYERVTKKDISEVYEKLEKIEKLLNKENQI